MAEQEDEANLLGGSFGKMASLYASQYGRNVDVLAPSPSRKSTPKKRTPKKRPRSNDSTRTDHKRKKLRIGKH